MLCSDRDVEDEKHFLLKCTAYSILTDYHHMNFENVPEMLNMDNKYQLSKFLLSAFELRQRLIWGRAGGQGGISKFNLLFLFLLFIAYNIFFPFLHI